MLFSLHSDILIKRTSLKLGLQIIKYTALEDKDRIENAISPPIALTPPSPISGIKLNKEKRGTLTISFAVEVFDYHATNKRVMPTLKTRVSSLYSL